MNKKARKLSLMAAALIVVASSCNQGGTTREVKDQKPATVAEVTPEGVTLRVKDASLIQVDSNPQYNTAEWQFTVNKPGRYDVWLSSLTCDTSDMQFYNDVTITAGDTRIAKKPVGDEIVTTDQNIKAPWFRADSHMGSIFFSEPGEYQVQVISEKLIPLTTDLSSISTEKHTLINSLILKPMIN